MQLKQILPNVLPSANIHLFGRIHLSNYVFKEEKKIGVPITEIGNYRDMFYEIALLLLMSETYL